MKNEHKATTPNTAADSEHDHKKHAPPGNGKKAGTNPEKTPDQIKSLVLERISDGVLAFDTELNHVYLNERAGELLGCQPDQLIGKNFLEQYPQAIYTAFAEACRRALETQTIVKLDGYFSPSDHWFEGRVYPSDDGVSVIFTDQQKKDNKVSDNSRFPEQNPNPVMCFYGDGQLMYANTASDCVLSLWNRATGLLLPEHIQALVKLALESGSNQETEITCEGRIFSSLLVPLRESGYVNMYCSDITERKQVEHERNELLQGEQEQRAHAEQAKLEAEQAKLKAEKELAERKLAEAALGAWTDAPLAQEARSPWMRYGIPLAATLIAVLLRKLLDPLLGDYVQLTSLFGAIAFSVWYGGIGPALLSIIVGYLGISWLVLGWQHILAPNVSNLLGMGIFLFSSTVVMALGDAMRRAQHHAHQSARVAVERQRQLEHRLIEQQRAEQSLLESARRQTALYKLTDSLHRTKTLDDVFNASLDAILSALQCDRASILLFDETQIMHFVAWRGLSEEYRKATNGHSPWKYGEANPQPVFFNDIHTADLSDELKQVVIREGIGSLAFIPLVFQGNLLGKFMVYFNRPHEFSDDEIDLGLTIARQVATSVDRKHAEERLRASEEKYRQIVETANEGIWEIDKDTRTVFVNPRMAEMLGYTTEEMLGRSAFEFLLPEDHSEGEQRLERAKEGGSSRAAEFRYRRKDNSIVWTIASNTTKQDEEGNFLGAVAMMSDITERKRAEEALRQSEERFAQFMDHLPGLAWIKDIQGHYMYANAAAEKAFQKSREELYGKTDLEVFPLHVAAQFQHNDERAVEEGQGIQVVEQLEQEDGILHYSLVSKFPIPGSDGKTALIGGTAFDITERKQAEEALKESRERYQNLFNLVPIAVYTCDASGLIQEYNHRAVELWGRAPEKNDPSEKYCGSFKIYYPDGRLMPHTESPMARVLQGESLLPHEFEILVERLDGLRRNVIAHPLLLRNEQDETIGAINCLYDITERKQAEDRLALLVEVSELIRNIDEPGELMSAVAHAVGSHLQVKRCLFNEIDVEQDREIVHNDYHERIESVAGVHKISDYSSVTSAEMMAGRTVVNSDSKTDPRTADDFERSYVPNGERAYVAVPLMRDDRWVASLWVSDDQPRLWNKDDVSLLETIAERTWTATEKLRINAALQENQQRLSLTYEHAAIGIVETSQDGRYIRANDEFCRALGYEKEEVLERCIQDLTYPEDYPNDAELYQQLMAGEIPFYRMEKRYVKKDGSVIWTQLVRSTVRGADGTALYGIGAIFDITERKRVEEELRQLNLKLEDRVEKRTFQLRTASQLRRLEMVERRQAEDRFFKTFNASPAAMSITRFEDGMYRNVNPKFVELLEYDLTEIIGNTSLNLRIYKNIKERIHLLKSIRNNKGKWEYEEQLETKSGKLIDVTIFVVEIELEGEPHLLSTIVDITERKQMMNALRSSEQQLRTLFNVLPVDVSYVRPDGQVIQSNAMLEKILGVPQEGGTSGSYRSRKYIRPDGSLMLSNEFASIRALTEQRIVQNVETGVVKENGQVVWLSVSAAPVSTPEVGAVVITTDITERKHMDDELRKSHKRYQVLSQRLVEIQEEERRTISRELHDRVGQSLAALNLNLNFLNSQFTQDAQSQQARARLKDAIQLTEETVSTIRDVMADLRPPALDDYGLEAALNAYASTFSRRSGIQVVSMKSGTPLPPISPSIELTLLRIAQEALTNVSRHSRANRVTMMLGVEGNVVHLTIEDNGEGILSWQKANRPGSHGLKIMRERAEAFGGKLQIQSAHKKGTTIDVRIPMQNEDPHDDPMDMD